MKLLFINPPSKNNKQFVRLIDCSHEAKASYLWQPNDFMIISSYLSDSDEGFLLDGTCDQMSDQLFFKKLDEYKEADVDLIFFATGSACYYEDLEYFHSIRKLFFEKTICVLGDIFVEKNFREHILNNDADGIVYKPYNLEIKEKLTSKC